MTENFEGANKATLLLSISHVLALKGKVEQAEEMADKSFNLFVNHIKQAVEEVNSRKNMATISGQPEAFYFASKMIIPFVKDLMGFGYRDKAIEIVSIQLDESDKNNDLYSLLDKLIDQGDVDRALKIPDLMPFKISAIYALNQITTFCENNGQSERAGKIGNMRDKKIEEEIEIAKSESKNDQHLRLGKIMNCLINIGQIVKASEVRKVLSENLEKTIESAKLNGDNEQKFQIIIDLLKELEFIQDFKKHSEVSALMKEMFPESFLQLKGASSPDFSTLDILHNSFPCPCPCPCPCPKKQDFFTIQLFSRSFTFQFPWSFIRARAWARARARK